MVEAPTGLEMDPVLSPEREQELHVAVYGQVLVYVAKRDELLELAEESEIFGRLAMARAALNGAVRAETQARELIGAFKAAFPHAPLRAHLLESLLG